MAQHMSIGSGDGDRFVQLDDGEMHVMAAGDSSLPALLLIHGAAASAAIWGPVVPRLAGTCRVIRIDLLGCGRSSSPAGGYDIVTQARRVGAALDRMGAGRMTVIGHSTGGVVATALGEQCPGKVAALALIDTGPTADAKVPEPLLTRLLLTRFPGRVLWGLKTEAAIRKGARTAFTRPIDIPDFIIEDVRGMTHRAFAGSMRAPLEYLSQQGLPGRLSALDVPVLVLFGTDDKRWRSSSVAAYHDVPGIRVELLPGIGHTPMLEDPQATSDVLLDFAAAAQRPR